MKLFELNSTEDLICRGYKQNEILELTGVDTGYHNNKYKTLLKGIDRTLYKYEHIKQRFTNDEIQLILDYYYHGATKQETLNKLLIHDYEKLNLKKCFTYLGYQEQFEIANKNNKRNYWQKGMLEKYNTDNIFKLKEFQEKATETRLKKFGGKYTLSPSNKLANEARRKSITTNKSEQSKNKRKQTNIDKYGYPSPSQNNDIKNKSKQTSLKKYGVEYPTQANTVKEKRKNTNLKKYGVVTNLQLQSIKEKIKQTNLDRYGVPYYSQTKLARTRQSKYMKKNKNRIIQTKKQNGTLLTSNPENEAFNLLKNIFPDIIHQYTSTLYPHTCDFYIPSKKLYIELNASWTHNSHWFDSKSESDNRQALNWSNSTKYYQNAYKTWTHYDVIKRNNARQNNLNYLVLWQPDLSDLNLWIQMGCPDAKDWEREYSWLDITSLPKINQKHFIPLKNGSKTITKIARQFMYPVIYEREINMWNKNAITNKGYIQPFLFANRLKYINKLPHELSDLEIIRGFSISGKIRAYTAFDNTLMKQVIKTYQPKSIYDPCAGWGERLLTAATYDIEYYGQDINDKLLNPYQEMIQTYNLNKQTITITDSSQTKNTADMLFTCPPYGNTEIYTDKGSENLSETEFLNWWNTIIKNSNVNIIAFQINQKWKNKMSEVVKSNGYKFIEELTSVTNASHLNKNKKEYESVMVFNKV